MTEAFPALVRQDDARYAITVGPDLAVGPPGHAYLFGGVSMALALDVAADSVGRPVVQGSLQFVSFTPLGSVLDLAVEVLQSGRTLAQARVAGTVDGRLVFHSGISLGMREGFSARQWALAPPVPQPDHCPPCTTLPAQDGNARYLEGIEVREAGGPEVPSGRTRLWLRRKDGASLDAASLAMFADFLPIALGRATGCSGGGNSLDNSLRIAGAAAPGWCLCDMIIPSSASGFAQGQVTLWDQSGRLLATGAQSLLLKG